MFTDPKNPLHNEVISRREALKQRILDVMKDPQAIRDQQDMLFVEKYDSRIALFFYTPAKGRRYETVTLDCNLTEESRHRIFCYERNWEEEGYNQSTPVIEIKDGRQVECGILNLDDLDDKEREEIEFGFNQVQRIITEENATIEE